MATLSMILMATSVSLFSRPRPRYTLAKLPRPRRRPSWYFSSMIEPLPPPALVVLLILAAEFGC